MNIKIPLLFAAVIIIFIADLNFPIGMETGISYVLIIIAASRYSGTKTVYAITGLSSVFLILAVLGTDHPENQSIINRFIAIILFWIISIVVLRLKKYEFLLKEKEKIYRNLAEQASDKLKAEKALEESQARLSGIVSSAMDAIITINSEQKILLFNRAAEKMFGYKQSEILDQKLSVLIPPELRQVHKQYVINFGETGITSRHMGALGAVRGVKKNSTEFPIEASISQIVISGEKLFTVILRDITERDIAEQNLLESENRFRNMADNAPVLIWLSDEKMNINYFNKTWLNFTGRAVAQEENSGWYENIHPEDKEQVRDVYKSSFENHNSFTIEFRLKRSDGIYRWILNQGIPRFIHERQFIGYIGSGIDITERKIFEAQLNASLKEKEVLLKEVHHRVKNNLQIISSLLNLQSEHIKDEKMIDLLIESQNRIKSMALIHEKLYQTEALSKIDTKGYITELVDNLMHSYLQDRNEIRLNLDIDNIEMDIDSGIDLGLIINELLSNTLKYAFPPGFKGEKLISIYLKRSSFGTDKILLRIKDTGIGISEGFNIHEAKSLGLQLVDTLVQQLEGSFEFKNKNGTEFIIEF